nr:iron and copper transporter IacT-like [Nerophis lumbriciformis]
MAQEGTLEEIIVTSQRREQSLQEVPIAVTAFSGEELAKQNIKSATEYLQLTPNVSFTEDGQSGSRGLGIAIRGINNLVSGENAFINSIGLYIDEFSVTSVPNQVANPFLPDMERVEVLRGPQGTYFGRNSVGGAMNLTTRAPTDEFEGSLQIGGESYDNAGEQFNATGVLNMPVSDNFAMRGVLYYEDSSGLVDNACARGASASSCPAAAENGFTPNGTADSGHEYTMARLKGAWTVSDSTNIDFTIIYNDESQGTDENVPSGILDIDSADSFGLTAALDPGTGFWPNNRNRLSHDQQEANNLETTVAIVNVEHTFANNTTLNWITGVIDAEQDRVFDNDLIGGADTLVRTNTYKGDSVSTELRLTGSGNASDWIVGLLYASDEQTQDNNVAIASQATATLGGVGWLPPFPQGLGLALNHKEFEVESLAVFADYTWHASDQWDITIGGRYTSDDVENSVRSFGIGPSCNPNDADCNFFGGFVNSPRPLAAASDSFTDFAPRLAVTYNVSDDVNLYGVISKGYKAGGNSVGNQTNLDGSPAFSVPFDEEILWNYEIGLKSQLLDNRLRLNVSAFLLDWEDFQMEAFRFLTPGDLSSNFEQAVNVGEAEAAGIELEFIALLNDYFTLGGSFGILDTEITSNTTVEITGGAMVNLLGLEIPKAPENTLNVFGEFRYPAGNNEWWLRAEVIHRDGQYSDIEGLTNRQTRSFREVGPGEFPYLSPSYTVVNLRGGYDWERFGVMAYVPKCW